MHAQIEMVSPAMAKEYLEPRLPNRHLSDTTVTRYASDMKEGRWLNNGQGLVFDDQGNLIDGQHRCQAIIISQMTVSMLVVRGVPSRAMETIDTNRPRSLADVLHMQGGKSTTVTAAAARICWNYAAGVSFGYSPSKPTLLSFIKTHPHVIKAVTMVENAKRAGMITRSPLVALITLATAGDRLTAEAQKFVDGVIHGEGLYKGDARLTLRNWVASNRAERTFSSQSVSEPTFGAIIRAWNAYAQGRELQLVKFPPAVNRDTMPVFGFYQIDWPDVPDRVEQLAASRAENLARAHQVNAAKRALALEPQVGP
jgi:hypothetical protein